MESAKEMHSHQFLTSKAGSIVVTIIRPIGDWCYGSGTLEYAGIIIGQCHCGRIATITPAPNANVLSVDVVVICGQISGKMQTKDMYFPSG